MTYGHLTTLSTLSNAEMQDDFSTHMIHAIKINSKEESGDGFTIITVDYISFHVLVIYLGTLPERSLCKQHLLPAAKKRGLGTLR